MNVRVSGLRDLLELADSGTWGDDGDPKTGAPVLRSSNIQGGQLDLTDFAWRVIPENDLERCRLAPGDIIVTKSSGSANLIGKCCIFDTEDSNGPYYFSNFTLRLRVRDGVADHRWIYYWLISERGRAALASLNNTTSGLRNLSVPRYLEQKLPTPPLEDQRRFAAILNKADAIRRKRQEAIALTEQLLRSTFLEMFGDPVANLKGWPTVTLASLILEGPTNGLYRPASDYGEGVPIVRIDSFHGGQITDLASLKRVNISQDIIDKFRLSPGQILVNRVNSPEHLGKAALVPSLFEPTVFESNMMRLTVNPERVCPEFLIDQLASHYIKIQIERCRKDASNQSSINQDDVGGFEIRLPPIKTQHRYRDVRSAMHSHRARLQGSRVHADNLFNSLVQRAFTGQL